MIKWICKYCGEDTTRVDYDYLMDTDHLSCALKAEGNIMKKRTTLITVSAEMILDNSNDAELGAKVRQLYYENNS